MGATAPGKSSSRSREMPARISLRGSTTPAASNCTGGGTARLSQAGSRGNSCGRTHRHPSTSLGRSSSSQTCPQTPRVSPLGAPKTSTASVTGQGAGRYLEEGPVVRGGDQQVPCLLLVLSQGVQVPLQGVGVLLHASQRRRQLLLDLGHHLALESLQAFLQVGEFAQDHRSEPLGGVLVRKTGETQRAPTCGSNAEAVTASP